MGGRIEDESQDLEILLEPIVLTGVEFCVNMLLS